jgi:hypothetical protein
MLLVAGLGSALLVLAFGVLLAAIALLWTSVRTLSGDAPLAGQLVVAAGVEQRAGSLEEEKWRVMRALKDLEAERALGRLDEVDYAALLARYRDEAKGVMRQLDLELMPAREEAERIAQQYLERNGARGPAGSPNTGDGGKSSAVARLTCSACGGSNEQDAAFCKSCGGAMKRAGTQ